MSGLNHLFLYVISLFLFHEVWNQNVPNKDQIDTTMEYFPEDSYDQKNVAEEYIMLGLRTNRGISFLQFEKMSGKCLRSEKQVFLQKCQTEEYIVIDGDNLRLTEKGFYLSTAIIGEILA